MARTQERKSPQAILWELEGSFGSLACHAAMEIDNILRSKDKCLDAVCLLAQAIQDRLVDVKEAVSPESLLDPATVALMNQAIRASNLVAAPGTITELIHKAAEITKEMKTLARDAETINATDPDRLKKIQMFCLSLSEKALAQEHPMSDKHPQVPPEILSDGFACIRT